MNTALKVAAELEVLEQELKLALGLPRTPSEPLALNPGASAQVSSRAYDAVRALEQSTEELWEVFQQLLPVLTQQRDAVRVLAGVLQPADPQVEVVEDDVPVPADSDEGEEDAEISQSN